METKTKRIDLRASEADEKNMKKAAAKLGSKKISDTIFGSLAEFANAMPEMFFCDRDAIKSIDSNINLGLINLQKFLDEFKKLTGQNLSRDECEHCLEGLGKLGSRQIVQTAISELFKAKLYEQKKLKYPDLNITYDLLPDTDLSNLFKIAENLDLLPTVKMQYVGIYWRVYSVTGNVVSVIPDQVEQIKAAYRHYASGPEQLAKLAKVRKLCEVMNALCQDKELLPERIFSLVYYDREGATFAPTGSYVVFNALPQLH